MSTVTLEPATGALLASPRKRWTIAEFDRLTCAGLLAEGSRAYLWDFEIVEPMPENWPHVNAVANVVDLLKGCFPSTDWTVNQGAPVVLGEGYKPQPDVTVLRGPRSKFRGRSPDASDIVLLVEVSHSTYADDVGVVLRAYAKAGVPRYWVVNLHARRVEVFESPGGDDSGTACYQKRSDFGLGDSIPLEIVHDGVTAVGAVAVADILRDSLDDGDEGRAEA